MILSPANGQNRVSFKNKKQATQASLAPEREPQKPDHPALQVRNAKSPVSAAGLFFDSPAVTTATAVLYGYRMMNESFYSFSADNPANATPVKEFTDDSYTISAGELVNGDFYLTSCDLNTGGQPANLVRLSTETWTVVSTVPVEQHALDMAYDHSTKTMYAITASGTGSLLYTINLTTGTTGRAVQLPMRFVGISVHLNGTLYGISVTGSLYTINKEDGSVRLIGATGISPLVGEGSSNTQSIGFDHNSGQLYWAFVVNGAETSGLYEVNIATGAATGKGYIGTGMQLIALGVPYYASTNIPAMPTGLTVRSNAGEPLSATLRWTNPALARSGNALTALSSIRIERNGVPVHTIDNPAIGAAASWTDNTIPREGDYRYAVYGVTDGYAGTKALMSVLVGNDPCEVTAFPLFEGFEGAGTPACWTSIYHEAPNKPVPSTAEKHSGNQSWRFTSYDMRNENGAFLISPRLANTSMQKTLRFFYNTLDHDGERFRIGYSTHDNDPAHFTWVDYFEYVVTNGWVEYNRIFPADTKFIAIEYLTMFNWYLYIDDITIDEVPDNDVTVTAVVAPKSGGNLAAAEPVTVSVKNNGSRAANNIPVKFEVDGVLRGDEVIRNPIGAQETAAYTFNTKADLHEQKSYTLKAYTAWNSDIRPENDALSVKVTNFGNCVASLPLSENFEDASDLACWTIGYDPAKANKPGVAQIARSGKQSWSFSSVNEDSDQFLITPELPVGSGKQKSIQFYVNNPTHAMETEELFQIGYSTTGKDISSFNWSEVWGAEFTNGWVEFIAPPIPAAAKYICIHYFSGFQDHLYIDDLVVREISAVDVALAALLAPESGNDLTSEEKVTVVVRNAGTQPVSNVPVALELNGVVKGSGTVPGTIAPQDMALFTFGTAIDLSAVGAYAIKAYTALPTDPAPDNDTLRVEIANTGICKITAFPYTESFEEPFNASCWNFYNVDGNYYKWEKNDNFPRTGQSSAYHGGGPGEDGWLVSPKIALPSGQTLGLYFWSYNTFDLPIDYGKNSVWISTGSPNPNNEEYVEIGASLNPAPYVWEENVFNLDAYKGKEVYIAFRYQGRLQHSCFLDDISIVDITDKKDAGVTAITYPVRSAGDMGRETVTIRVKNSGGQSVSGLPVKLEVNGTVVSEEHIPVTINSLQEISYAFTVPADLSRAATYTIRAYTALEGDINAGNDAASVTVTNYGACEVTTFPYLEDFEREDDYFICWSVYNPENDARMWTPASLLGTQTIPAHSGRLVALHDDYGSAQDGWLISPKINIPSEDTYHLSFWTFTAWPDWWYLEESHARSSVWVSTGSNDPASGDFEEVWAARSVDAKWEEVKIILRKYAGRAIYVAFRYEGIAAHAWMVDDVSVSLLTGSDAGLTEIAVPEKVSEATPVKVKIGNFGAVTLTSVPLTYICNEEPPVTETFTGSILPGDVAEYTFKQTQDMSKHGFYRLNVAITPLPGDTNTENDQISLVVAYPDNADLYGYRLYSEDFSSVNDFRPFRFSFYNPSVLTEIGDPYIDGESNVVIAGASLDKEIYVYTRDYSTSAPGGFVRLSSDWKQKSRTPVSETPIDMTYDHANKKMYALTSAGSIDFPTSLKEVDLSTGEMTQVVELDYYLYTLAANLRGELFGIDSEGYFVSVNKETGITSVISEIGVYPYGTQSMTFDHNSSPERLFWAMYDGDFRQGRLVEIDPVSGKTIFSGPIGENAQIVALYTLYPGVSIDAPESDNEAIRIYPNPARGEVYLTSVPERSQIYILDLSGRTVFSDNTQSGKVRLNLNLETGIYMVVIENEGEKTVRKLIIK
ncbi:MAG: choice-of-anchor J domain-containing protein [Dysgonamonadaceae bacterium]|nr:choice-of-anchor J domain-containing protein [Dysgonamonadaceae bacterium]